MIALAYMPSIHAGTLKFIREAAGKGCTRLLVIDDKLAAELVEAAARDFNAPAQDIVTALQAVAPAGLTIEVLSKKELPDEEVLANRHKVVETFVETYAPKHKVAWTKIFLRWDMPAILAQELPEGFATVVKDPEHKTFMNRAFEMAEQSSDGFRRVGAVAVRDGKVIHETHNEPSPDAEQAHALGDPACWRQAGKDIHISIGAHAEQRLVAMAAGDKGGLRGADIYVTTFPCQNCSIAIAVAGFKRLFFRESYSQPPLNTLDILRSHGVEIYQVP